jgi:hypothetical protein
MPSLQVRPFDIVARVRNATFPGVSENAYRILLEEYHADTVEVIQRTKKLNTNFRLLPAHSGLRHLNICLYSPGLYNFSRMVLKAEPINECMHGLDAQSILGLKELHTITITARNGYPNFCKGLEKVSQMPEASNSFGRSPSLLNRSRMDLQNKGVTCEWKFI